MTQLLWLPINVLQGIFTLVWSASWILVGIALRALTGSTRVTSILARHVWAPGLMWVGGFRVEVRGLDNLESTLPCFYAANHQSILDIAILYRVLPAPLLFVTKAEYRWTPFLGWYMWAMGMIFIRREYLRQSLDNLGKCRRRLDEGNSILVFPEGTRSRDRRLKPLKSGAFVPAIDAGAPIVPIVLDGPGRMLAPDGFRPRPGTARVAVGRPIPTAGLSRKDRRELARQVRQQMDELWPLVSGEG